jgi:hypothetical protein
MASYRKTEKGWRAEIYVNGERDSGTFATKAQTQTWAAPRETELRQQKLTGVINGKTVRDAFDRYKKEVSKSKCGHRWEALRLNALGEADGLF